MGIRMIRLPNGVIGLSLKPRGGDPMPIYESISILKASLTDEDVQKILSKLEGIVKRGGELLSMENWGKKKLSYDVKKEKRGLYILYRFRGDGKNIPELERAYRFDDNIIKFMTVKLDKPMTAHVEKTMKAAPAPDRTGEGPTTAPVQESVQPVS
jgi:small subunit ribosomal protein S6